MGKEEVHVGREAGREQTLPLLTSSFLHSLHSLPPVKSVSLPILDNLLPVSSSRFIPVEGGLGFD